jgi:superfamily II DNA or RNA helicase
MAKIEIKGNRARILDENDFHFLEGLDLTLSYMIAGSEYSKAYTIGRWDGRRRLLNSDLSFSAGLLERVIGYYQENNHQISIIDRNKYSTNTPFDITANLANLGKLPRKYQEMAANIALEKKRGIIRLCTGGGKTLIAALIVANVGKRAIIYVIGKDLLWQFHRFFSEAFLQKIGVIGDGVCDIQNITIASIWTVGQAFGMRKKSQIIADDELPKEKKVNESHYQKIRECVYSAEVSILDECHLGAAETMQKIAASMRSEYAIGMSASPYRDDNADLLIEAIFGKVIVNISASELIEQGYLVQPTIRFIPVQKPGYLLYRTYPEIYNHYLVNNDYRNGLIVRGAQKLIEQDFSTMVLFKNINHGKLLYEKFQNAGVNCHILDGSDSSDRRKEVIDEISSGKSKLLLASSILDIGVDIPILSGLILAGGGKSSVRAVQRIGRVIRPYKGKTMAAILDFDDKVKYLKDHSMIRRRIYSSESGFIIG